MFWQEETERSTISDTVIDLAFSISCRQIPVDHAFALSCALLKALPWLEQEPLAAIHLIHVAESQHGWIRPKHSPDVLIYPSRRTKLTLRIPKARMADTEQLSGQILDIAGHELAIGNAKPKPLSRLGTLFARHIVSDRDEDEEQFLQRMAKELAQIDIHIRKALCGIESELDTPDGPLLTRSMMLADLPMEESIRLQQQGIGKHRLMGCGIFIPHKGIEAVKRTADDENS